jgi:hypothetical protein
MGIGSIAYDVETEKLISGSITAAAQTLDLSGPNSGADVIQITGTWVGTIIVEGSNDGTNFVTIPFIVQSTSLLGVSITANGAYIAASNGYNQTRIRASAWTSGTATITVYGSNSPSVTYTNSLLRGSTDGTLIGNSGDSLKVAATLTGDTNYGTVGANTLRVAAQIGNATGAADFNAGATGAQTLRTVANQGAPNTAANGWFQKITNGTNVAGVTSLSDLQVVDVPNQTGLSATLSLTTTAVEGKVGASTMTNRKYIEMQALVTNVKWGYDTTCPFDLFKSQFFSLPAGTNCKVYFKMSTGTGSVAIGEK